MLRSIFSLLITLGAFQASADHTVPAGQAEESKIAFGYNPDTQRFVGACVKGRVEQHGQAKANVSFSQSISESRLEKELGFEAGGRFRYGAAKIGVSASFLQSQRSSNFSIVAVYSGDYKFKNLLLTFPDPSDPSAKPADIEKERLSAVGLSVRHDDTRWMETCGEEYVAQIERGAKLYYSIRIDFSSQEERDLFEAGFSYDSSYASVHANLKNKKESFSKNTKVTIGALQIGGDARRVTELFNPSGADDNGASLGFIKCTFGDFSKCDQVMASAWEYATEQFKEQLKYNPEDQNSESGPAYINYITKKYSTAGIYNKFSSVLNKDIIYKRKEIEATFDEQMRLAAQTTHLLSSKTVALSKRQTTVLKQVDTTLRKNIDRLVEVAEICYNDPRGCPLAANSLYAGETKLTEIDPAVFVIEPEDYSQYCRLAESMISPKNLRESIAGMIAGAKELEPDAFLSSSNQPVDECMVSELVFKRNTSLPLKKKKISTLQPLSEFLHFVSVDLSDNEIEDLKPIAHWTDVEELNLHGNRLRDISVLSQFVSLEKLRVSNNRLADLDALTQLPNLIRVDARNNFPSLTCAHLKIKVCLSATVKTDSNFVPIQTTVVLPLFMPSIALMPNGEVFITGEGRGGVIFSAESNRFSAGPVASKDRSYGAQATAMNNGRILVSGGWQDSAQLYEFDVATQMAVAAGTLQVQRADHLSTLLADGRVLITGGWQNPVAWTGTDPSYTAEIYDPKTRVSTLLPKMHAPRAWHTATLLNDGRVLLTGGYSGKTSLATAEVFDPATNTFTLLKRSMSQGRGGHTATLLDDGNVLVVGGFDGLDQPSNTAEIFNVSQSKFDTIYEPLNQARGHHAAIRLGNGKVLITGGSEHIYAPDHAMQGTAGTSLIQTGELFNPSENSFAEIPAKMYVPRSRHAMVEIKPGMVLIVGGVDYVSTRNSEVFTYTDTIVESFPNVLL